MVNTIEFAKVPRFVQEHILKEIEKVIDVAGKSGGDVFGEYVREVLAPRSFNPNCEVKFRTVDLWFYGPKSEEKFIREMGKTFRLQYTYDKYKKQYQFIKDDTCIASFRVVVSETYPLVDLDINLLIARNEIMDGACKWVYAYYDEEKLDEDIEEDIWDEYVNLFLGKIRRKEASLLPRMIELYKRTDQASRVKQLQFESNLQEYYQDWTITYKSFTYDKKQPFNLWINNIINEEKRKAEKEAQLQIIMEEMSKLRERFVSKLDRHLKRLRRDQLEEIDSTIRRLGCFCASKI